MRCTVTQLARESVVLCPFRGSYVRVFELSHSKLVNRIIKITLAHNLHVKMLVFGPFTIRTVYPGQSSPAILICSPLIHLTPKVIRRPCDSTSGNLSTTSVREKSRGVYLAIG